MPCYPFSGEGSPTKIDCRKRDTLILTSLLEDLGSWDVSFKEPWLWCWRAPYLEVEFSEATRGWIRVRVCFGGTLLGC